jgi:hypothetical protein
MTISFLARAVETPSGLAVGCSVGEQLTLWLIAQMVVDIAAGSR